MKLKLVNNIFKTLLVILIVAIISLIFISDNYLKTSMGYYRIMFRFQEDFSDSFNSLFVIYSAVMFIITFIGKWKFGLRIKHAIVFIVLIIINYSAYLFLPEYLNKSVVTLVLFLMLVPSLLLTYTIKNVKYINILIIVIALITVCLIGVNYI
ncbi:MAG: hypothetical protein ACK5K7_07195 [Bacilli bacterium]